MQVKHRDFLIFSVIACVMLIFRGLYWVLNEIGVQWTWEYWGGRPSPDRSGILRNFALIIAGGIGLGLAGWRSWTASSQAKTALLQAKLAERGQNTERFQKSAAMLSDERRSVRQAGIYALVELAIADPEAHYMIIQRTLRGFVLEGLRIFKEENKHPPSGDILGRARPLSSSSHSPERTEFPDDLVSAIKAIGSVNQKVERTDAFPLLMHADLRAFPWRRDKLTIPRITMVLVDLREITFAVLKADLCVLRAVDFSGSGILGSFKAARITQAKFNRSKIYWTDAAADLDKGVFREAELENADFTEAHFIGIKFNPLKNFNPIFKETSVNDVDFANNDVGIEEKGAFWAWGDSPPRNFTNIDTITYFDPGAGGENRKAYQKNNRFGFPDETLMLPAELAQLQDEKVEDWERRIIAWREIKNNTKMQN